MLFSIRVLPLLVIPTVIYAMIALPMGADGVHNTLSGQFFSLSLPSGDAFVMTWGNMLLGLTLLTLFGEVVRSARPVNSSIVENTLSFLLFTVQLIAFLLVSGFGAAAFAMIMGMTLLDFTAGAMVMIYAARRDVQYNVAA